MNGGGDVFEFSCHPGAADSSAVVQPPSPSPVSVSGSGGFTMSDVDELLHSGEGSPLPTRKLKRVIRSLLAVTQTPRPKDVFFLSYYCCCEEYMEPVFQLNAFGALHHVINLLFPDSKTAAAAALPSSLQTASSSIVSLGAAPPVGSSGIGPSGESGTNSSMSGGASVNIAKPRASSSPPATLQTHTKRRSGSGSPARPLSPASPAGSRSPVLSGAGKSKKPSAFSSLCSSAGAALENVASAPGRGTAASSSNRRSNSLSNQNASSSSSSTSHGSKTREPMVPEEPSSGSGGPASGKCSLNSRKNHHHHVHHHHHRRRRSNSGGTAGGNVNSASVSSTAGSGDHDDDGGRKPGEQRSADLSPSAVASSSSQPSAHDSTLLLALMGVTELSMNKNNRERMIEDGVAFGLFCRFLSHRNQAVASTCAMGLAELALAGAEITALLAQPPILPNVIRLLVDVAIQFELPVTPRTAATIESNVCMAPMRLLAILAADPRMLPLLAQSGAVHSLQRLTLSQDASVAHVAAPLLAQVLEGANASSSSSGMADQFQMHMMSSEKSESHHTALPSVTYVRQQHDAAFTRAPALVRCANCGRPENVSQPAFKMCSRCRRVKYCSRQCQVQHWREGRHKRECVVRGSSSGSGGGRSWTGDAGSSSARSDPRHDSESLESDSRSSVLSALSFNDDGSLSERGSLEDL